MMWEQISCCVLAALWFCTVMPTSSWRCVCYYVCVCVCVFVCMCNCVCVSVSVSVRERERERERDTVYSIDVKCVINKMYDYYYYYYYSLSRDTFLRR